MKLAIPTDRLRIENCRRPWFESSIFALSLSLLLIAFALQASAFDMKLRPGIIGTDDREPTEMTANLEAVGQVNIAGFRNLAQCTGSLVAPRLVLTAAHCLTNTKNDQPYSPARIHFVAGVRPGNLSAGHSVAECIKLAADFKDGKTGSDIALIVLKKPIEAIKPLGVNPEYPLLPTTRLSHAGYPANRRFQLMLHRDCRISHLERDRFFTSCDSHPGSSGGPFLVETETGPEIIGVLNGAIPNSATVATRIHNLAASISSADCS